MDDSQPPSAREEKTMADTPSSFGKPGDGPVISVVVRQRGAGVAGARVRLIVNGVGQPTLRTDRQGAATWFVASTGSHPVRRANGYNYVVSAEKDDSAGRATGHAQPLAPTLVVVDVVARRPASPAARAGIGIMQGAARESSARTTAGQQRTAYEQLLEIAALSAKVNTLCRGLRQALQGTEWAVYLAEIDRLSADADSLRHSAMSGLELAGDTVGALGDEQLVKIFHLSPGRAKLFGNALGGVVDIVTTLNEIIDALRNDDVRGAVKAFGVSVLECVVSLHPIGATIVLAVHVAQGLKACLTPGPGTKSAVVRQGNLPEFSDVGSCPVFAGGKHWRIDLEHPVSRNGRRSFNAKSYSMCVPGLAFSVKHRGALVLVDVAGRELIVPTATDAQAARVREVIDYVHLNGWMTPHATRRKAS
jgi:hypothetical protein